jgi:putative transposase
MHTASHRIVDLLVKEGIGVLCIGKNDAWKQEINLGKRTNQNFVQIVRLVQPKPEEGRKAGKAQ